MEKRNNEKIRLNKININNKNFSKLGLINYIENVDNFNYIICTQKGLFIIKNLFENNSEPIKLLPQQFYGGIKINKFIIELISNRML